MIKIVRVDPEYIKKLLEVDKRIFINSIEAHKQARPFLGILFNVGYIEYFVPMTSAKPKHSSMNNSADFEKIVSRNGEIIGALNFNNMVPVVASFYNEIDINTDKYKTILHAEYEYFMKNENNLKRKAKAYYDMFCNNRLSEAQRKRTCDFLALERVLIDILKNENSVNSARYQASHSKKSSDDGKSK